MGGDLWLIWKDEGWGGEYSWVLSGGNVAAQGQSPHPQGLLELPLFSYLQQKRILCLFVESHSLFV